MTQHHRVVPGGHGSTGRQVAPSASTSLSRMAPQPRAALFGWRLSPGTFLSCVVALRDERLGDPPPFLLCLLLREDSSKKQANFLGPIFILCLLVRVYAVNVLSAWTLVFSRMLNSPPCISRWIPRWADRIGVGVTVRQFSSSVKKRSCRGMKV